MYAFSNGSENRSGLHGRLPIDKRNSPCPRTQFYPCGDCYTCAASENHLSWRYHYKLIVRKSRTHQLQGQVDPHMRRLPRSHSCRCPQSFAKRKSLRKMMLWNKLSHKPKKGGSQDTSGPEGWIKLSKKRVKWGDLSIPSRWMWPNGWLLWSFRKPQTVLEDLQSLQSLRDLLLKGLMPDTRGQHSAVAWAEAKALLLLP